MPLPIPNKNLIIQRIKADGIFGGGLSDPNATPTPGPDIGQLNAMNNAGVYMPGTFGASNALANGTGNIFGGGMDGPAAPTATSAPAPMNTNVFGGGMPASVPVNPIHAYAPTDLRSRTLAAGGQGVWGQGDVMAFSNGLNPQGGQSFSLGQVTPVGGPMGGPVQPANPIGQETLQPAGYRPAVPTPAGARPSPNAPLLAAFEPDSAAGKYLRALEAATPGRAPDMEHLKLLATVDKNVAQSSLGEKKLEVTKDAATQKTNDATNALHEAARHGIESANLAIGTIDKMLPEVNSLSTGAAAALTSGIPGTPAFRLNELKKTVGSQTTLSALASLKAASKTGASGFGQLSDKEGKLLEDSLGNLNLSQDTKQVAAALQSVRSHYAKLKASYKMGLIDEKTATQEDKTNQAAVKWALDHPDDARSAAIILRNQ